MARTWKTNEEADQEYRQLAIQEIALGGLRGLQEKGLVSPNWGLTRSVPQVNSFDEVQRLFSDALDDYQMNQNGGLPVSSIDTQYDDTYLAKRREFIEAHEGFRSRVYEDHKGIRTVGVGINLEDPTTQRFMRNAGWDVDGLITGRKQFSRNQLDILLDHKLKEAERFVSAKVKVPLTSNQRIALVSLAFNSPELIGPNLTHFVNTKDWKNAEEEIRMRSNLRKHRGVQNRRNAEADVFAMDTHEPAPHFNFA